MTYKDITWCVRKCNNNDCFRNNNKIPSGITIPISYGGFNGCSEYIEPKCSLSGIKPFLKENNNDK